MPPTRGDQPAPPALARREDWWLLVLAGNDPHLLTDAGDPMVTLISVALGLHRTTLWKISSGDSTMGAPVMRAIASFLAANRGFTQDEAEAWAFARARESVARSRQAVAA